MYILFVCCKVYLNTDIVYYLQFVPHTVSAPYKRKQREFEVHVRSVWQWALDLLRNPHLAPHFMWDAERLYKQNGIQFQRFYDEPWTADSWWNIQVSCITVECCL